MILIIGASGRLGKIVTRQLLEQHQPLRVMTRKPLALAHLEQQGVEVVEGDLRQPTSLMSACHGIKQVVLVAHALLGTGGNTPQAVDGLGHRTLIDTAKASSVEHIIFTSLRGASAEAPLEFFRIKYETEVYLRASNMRFTIFRPSPFMELWAEIIGQPLLEKGKTMIFGRGNNPINFVSVEDVARYICLALTDARAANAVIEVGGPANLTLNQVAACFERMSDITPKNQHLPLQMMRFMALILPTVSPTLSRQIGMGIYMDTANLSYDMTETAHIFGIPMTTMDEVAQRLAKQVHSAATV